jgi:hypothetical protein
MAERKRATQIPEETAPLVPEEGGDIAEETAPPVPEEGGDIGLNEPDPWLEMVKMYVPKKPKGEEQQYYICVNERRYLVPANGKLQELPLPVAEVLTNSLEKEDEADEYAESIQKIQGIIKQ